MDIIEEILPGLEEFLSITLGSESLSNFAEERRQFFIECLDIIKLPPTLPPREGRVLSPELLKESEEASGVPAQQLHPHHGLDFAATQRKISRSLAESNPGPLDVVDGIETVPDKPPKIYDDVDSSDSDTAVSTLAQPRPLSEVRISCEDAEDGEGGAVYEIPVARGADSLDQPEAAESSSSGATGSTEESLEVVMEPGAPHVTVPPPLPPRGDLRTPELVGGRNSVNLDEKPPELPFRPPLPKRNELHTRSDKSDRSEKSNNSDPELSGDGDSTSYESFEEEEQQEVDSNRNKLSVQLPNKSKKKISLRKSRKLSKSRSSSQWEISVPFRNLDTVDISGEMYYRGKLKWNRRVVAISKGCIAVYKPDKDSRPSLVIPLTGYVATMQERDGRRGFELKLSHPNAESHSFSVDFKDWALLWLEHINGNAQGVPPARYHTHLARTFSGEAEGGGATTGSKLNLSEDNSPDLEYDEVNYKGTPPPDELFIREDGDCDSVKSTPTEPVSHMDLAYSHRLFQSEKSPGHSKKRTLLRSKKSPPMSAKDRTLSATVKDILRRRQRATYNFQNVEPTEESQTDRYIPKRDIPLTSQAKSEGNQENTGTSLGVTTSALSTLSRWGWKNILYSWSLPLDQMLLTYRRTDLAGSTSNVSTGSEAGSEDSLRPKNKGNKVMRMGSFAFRATQFFENIGKKTLTKKKSHQTSFPNLRHSGDFSDIHNNIIEESFDPVGSLARSRKTTISDSNLTLLTSGNDHVFSLPPLPMTPDFGKHRKEAAETSGSDVIVKGYLLIFSTFNKRRWGKRWCLIKANMFECYKNESSDQRELNFLLKPCLLRRAVVETNSENGLMIMEGGREKITVEPLSKDEMAKWVQALLQETSTLQCPDGLEEYVKKSNTVCLNGCLLLPGNLDDQTSLHGSAGHDYEDPTETISEAAKFSMNIPSRVLSQSSTCPDLKNNSVSSRLKGDLIGSDVEEAKSEPPMASSKIKHTTDSGFYSAKGVNSDSDSSTENAELNFECSSHFSGSNNAASSPVFFKKEISNLTLVHETMDCLRKDVNNEDLTSSDKCDKIMLSDKCALSSISSVSSSSRLQNINQSNICESESPENICTNTQIITKNNSNVNLHHHVNPPTSSSLANNVVKCKQNRSEDRISPPREEEYSTVLKKSERSLKSSETSCACISSSVQRDSVNLGINDFQCNQDAEKANFSNNLYLAETESANVNNEPSYYEPVCASNYICKDLAKSSKLYLDTGLLEPRSKSNSMLVLNSFDLGAAELPPPIPTSPIPHLVKSGLFASNDTLSALHGEKLQLNSSIDNLSSLQGVTLELNASNKTLSSLQGEKKLGALSIPNFDLKNEDTKWSSDQKNTSRQQVEHMNNQHISDNDCENLSHLSSETIKTVNAQGSCTKNISSQDVNTVPPSPDSVTSIIKNPMSTTEDLRALMEHLKHRQTENKRKRLAVHEKRQRAVSDDDRLTCEKEFATLDQSFEATESDLRNLQNQLDMVQDSEVKKPVKGKNKVATKKKKRKL